MSYLYDALGRRVAHLYQGQDESSGWESRVLVYDGLRLVEERALNPAPATPGPLRRRYYYEDGMNRPALMEDAVQERAFVPLTDDRGTVMGVMEVTDPAAPVLLEKLYYNATGLCKSYHYTGSGWAESAHGETAYNLGRSAYCQRRSKIRPLGRSQTRPLDVMRYAVLRVVPVVHSSPLKKSPVAGI